MSFHDIEQFLKEKEPKQIIKEGLDKDDQLLKASGEQSDSSSAMADDSYLAGSLGEDGR